MTQFIPSALVLLGLLVAVSGEACGNPPFVDPLEPFKPKNPRTEADEDRVQAAALYAHGRILFQRRDFAKAARRFQRAWRYDPQLVPLMDDVVRLSFSLNRNDEATRYAVIAAEQDPRDADLLDDLGGYLLRREDVDRAVAFYEAALKIRRRDPPAPPRAVLLLKIARLRFLIGPPETAAAAFAAFQDVLDRPARYKLEPAQVKRLIDPAARTYRLMGESFLAAKKWDAAAAALQRAKQAGDRQGPWEFDQARIAAGRDDWDAVDRHLKQFLKRPTAVAGTRPYSLLDLLFKKRNPDDTPQQLAARLVGRLAEVHRQDASCAPLNIFLAGRLADVGKHDQAESIYRATLKLEDAPVDAWRGLADLYGKTNDEAGLIRALGELVLVQGSLDGVPAVEKIQTDAKRLKAFVAKLEKHEPGQERLPGVALAGGMLAVAGKHYAAADRLFLQASREPKPDTLDVLATWGSEMLEHDQFARAEDAFRRSLAAAGPRQKTDQLYLLLASALALQKKTADALGAVKRAIALRPDSPYHHGRLAWILYHAKRFKDAQLQYERLLERFDKRHDSLETREVMREARLILSNINLELDRPAAAVEWLEQVLDEFPEDIGAANDLGYLWADRGEHLERALGMIQRAVAAEPDNRAYRDSLGWVYYRLGRLKDAVEELEQAAASPDVDGVILDHLGHTYAKLGRREQAAATWTRARAAFDKSGDQERRDKVDAKLKQYGKPD